MKSIKHKTFEILSSNELGTFTSQELQKAIWIAQGNKTPFDKRKIQYGTNIRDWIYDGLMTHEGRNEYILTECGLYFGKLDKLEGKKYLKSLRKRLDKKRKENYERSRKNEEWISEYILKDYKNDLRKNILKDCKDAIEYFWVEGMISQMRSDDRYYTKVLLDQVANIANVKLIK
jgi:hypothetical protein